MLDGVFELADVSRPLVGREAGQGIGRKPGDGAFRLARVPANEPAREQRDIGATFTERR